MARSFGDGMVFSLLIFLVHCRFVLSSGIMFSILEISVSIRVSSKLVYGGFILISGYGLGCVAMEWCFHF